MTKLRICGSTAGALLAGAMATVFLPIPADEIAPASVHSLRVVDRNGIVLREYLNDRHGRGQWRSLDRIAQPLQDAVVAAEDRRFFLHPGIDPIALVRAAWENVWTASRRSGASTITQQVIRSIRPRARTFTFKAVEAWDALRLERMLSKREILEQYLNRAPFGNQLVGAESAARHYLGKPASDLSLAEAAFLAALPNAPSALNPYKNPEAALKRRGLVLRRMLGRGMIQPDEYERAFRQPMLLRSPEATFRAPHAVEFATSLLADRPDVAEVHTTIDARMHAAVQAVVRNHIGQLASRNVTNAAVVVIENSTGAIRVMAGSANYFDEEHQGQVNGALALRQSGSSIKPLTYAAALTAGLTPASIIPDIPLQIPGERGTYAPENYDRRFHGPVRLRTALACSYNIPAVWVARETGLQRLLELYRASGLTTLTEPADHYGFGLTLGNADVRLLELTNAYAAIACGGVWQPARVLDGAFSVDGTETFVPLPSADKRILSPAVAALLTDILSDVVARRPAFGSSFHLPFDCAVKTGTTKDFRDNWTIGYTTRYTVGVWAGNFDGTSMRGVSGVTGAGSIFTDVMMILHDIRNGDLPEPFPSVEGLDTLTICVRSGLRPTSSCVTTILERFRAGTTPKGICTIHRRFQIPGSGGLWTDRVYEVFPEEYRDWSREQGIEEPPSDARIVSGPAIRTSTQPSSQRLALLNPSNGDHFKMDPMLRRNYQTIRVQAHVPDRVTDAALIVNGEPAGTLREGRVWWPLRKGVHCLQVRARMAGGEVASRPVTVTVD